MDEKDAWFDMAMRQMDLFDKDPEVYFKMLVASKPIRDIWKTIYSRSVYKNQLVRIEDVPVEIKNEIWEHAKDLAGQLLTKQETIDLSKALLTIKVFAGVL